MNDKDGKPVDIDSQISPGFLKGLIGGLAGVAAVLLTRPAPLTPLPTRTPEAEAAVAATRVVCDKIQRLARDVSTGQVNFVELRPRVQELYTRGKFTPSLEPKLREMLLGVTNEDLATFSRGIDAMKATCP